jgi:hypothetical protein
MFFFYSGKISATIALGAPLRVGGGEGLHTSEK